MRRILLQKDHSMCNKLHSSFLEIAKYFKTLPVFVSGGFYNIIYLIKVSDIYSYCACQWTNSTWLYILKVTKIGRDRVSLSLIRWFCPLFYQLPYLPAHGELLDVRLELWWTCSPKVFWTKLTRMDSKEHAELLK